MKTYNTIRSLVNSAFKPYLESIETLCNTECMLINRFKPQVVFIEDGRDDVREAANKVNAEYVLFSYDEKKPYEASLIKELAEAACSNLKTVGVIGGSHLQPAKMALKKKGLSVHCVKLTDTKDVHLLGGKFAAR